MNEYSEGALLLVSLLGVFLFAGVAFGLFGAVAWVTARFLVSVVGV